MAKGNLPRKSTPKEVLSREKTKQEEERRSSQGCHLAFICFLFFSFLRICHFETAYGQILPFSFFWTWQPWKFITWVLTRSVEQRSVKREEWQDRVGGWQAWKQCRNLSTKEKTVDRVLLCMLNMSLFSTIFKLEDEHKDRKQFVGKRENNFGQKICWQQ